MGMIEKQGDFALAVAALIFQINAQKHWNPVTQQHEEVLVTLGDAYRDPRLHGEFGEKKAYGRARSVHKMRLAIDLNLFIGGEWQTDTEAHRPYGEWWEETYKTFDAVWGGRWDDGNHYSFRVWGSA